MRSTLLSLVAYALNSYSTHAQAVENDHVVVDFQTGYVDGIPLPGDLANNIFTTETGRAIASILELNITAQSLQPTTVISLDDTSNPCIKWAEISVVLTGYFKNETTGECTDYARAAVRAGFHDAGTWSAALAAQGQDFGGADGSIFLFQEAETRPANNGLQDVVKMLGNLAIEKGVGVGDIIQFAAAHATVTCPLGARMRTFIGRKDATQASPDGLLPSATSNATTLVALFRDKGISGIDLVALVGAHSVSKQFSFDTTKAGYKQDSTPGVWDTNFYSDTIRSNFPVEPEMLTFPSDKALSLHAPLQEEWNGYASGGRENDWVEHFSRAYLRLSLSGVNQIQSMIECTNALPLQITTFNGVTIPNGPIIEE